jgi:uncharacterized lipoprotein
MMKRMNKVLLLMAVVALAGCSSPSGTKTGSNPKGGSSARVGEAAPRFEHQLDIEYAEGATPFLRLVEVDDP